MNLTPSDYSTIGPLILLTVWACVLLLVDLFIPKDRKGITALLSVLGLALTLGFTLAQIGPGYAAFNGMVVIDGFAVFVNVLLLVSGLLGIARSKRFSAAARWWIGWFDRAISFQRVGEAVSDKR